MMTTTTDEKGVVVEIGANALVKGRTETESTTEIVNASGIGNAGNAIEAKGSGARVDIAIETVTAMKGTIANADVSMWTTWTNI